MSTPTEQTGAIAPAQDTKEVVRAATTEVATQQDVSNKTWFRGVPPDHVLNRMYGFSKAICHAAFISPVVRGDEASVFYMVSMAEDLGIQWTHGLRSIYPLVKRGKDGDGDQIRAGIQGDIVLALLLKNKFKVTIRESTDEIATVWMERPDKTMEFQDSFTFIEAQKLGLTGKPNWGYKKDMLRWRAIMRVGRLVAADLIGGLHLADELEDLPAERGDNSNGAFREQAEKNQENENPFVVNQRQAPEPATPSNETEKQEVPVSSNGQVAQSTAAEAEPPKTRRGSSAKKETVAPLTETAPAEAPKPGPAAAPAGGFRSSEDDLPAELRQSPATEKPKSQKERLDAVTDSLMALGHRQREAIQKAVKAWIMAFTSKPWAGQPPQEIYEEPIPFLEGQARMYGAQVLQDPHTTGLTAGAGWGDLVRYMDKWAPETKALGKAIAVQFFPDNPALLQDFLDAAQADGALPESELAILMKVYRISTKVAMEFKSAADAKGMTMGDFAGILDLDKAKEQNILTLIAGGKQENWD